MQTEACIDKIIQFWDWKHSKNKCEGKNEANVEKQRKL